MKVIAIANQKGGTGKTTTALAFAQAAQLKSLKVLCVDLDGQANLTAALKATPEKGTAFDFIDGTKPETDCVLHLEGGIDLIPGAYDLCTLKTSRGSANRLKEALEALGGNYDLVIIDTPPLAGEAQYNALAAATDLVIPTRAGLFDVEAVFTMIATAQAMKKSNPGLNIAGYIFTDHNGRNKLAKALEENLKREAGPYGVPCLGIVRQSVAVREAQALGVSLFEYAPKSKPAADYITIFETLLKA